MANELYSHWLERTFIVVRPSGQASGGCRWDKGEQTAGDEAGIPLGINGGTGAPAADTNHSGGGDVSPADIFSCRLGHPLRPPSHPRSPHHT